MGLPAPFRKYRLLVKEIKITIILYTISRVMNTFSVLVIVEDFYRANYSALFKF